MKLLLFSYHKKTKKTPHTIVTKKAVYKVNLLSERVLRGLFTFIKNFVFRRSAIVFYQKYLDFDNNFSFIRTARESLNINASRISIRDFNSDGGTAT